MAQGKILEHAAKLCRVAGIWFFVFVSLFFSVEILWGLCCGFSGPEPLPFGFKQYYEEVFQPKFRPCVIDGEEKLKFCLFSEPSIVIDAKKSPETYRVIVLGGSFAQGWGRCYGFVEACRTMFPGKKVEVVNLAFGGYDSYRVEVMAREAARYDPDCVLIASGNNEMYSTGRFRLWSFKLRRRLRQSRIFRFFDNMLTATDSLYIPREQRISYFRQNISNAIQHLLSKGINVAICTLNGNQRHWPPTEENLFASGSFTVAKLLLYDKRYESFWELIDNGAFNGVQEADTLFLKARALDEQGKKKEAAVLYLQAKDLGGQRVYSGINRHIRSLAKEFDLALLDIEKKTVEICPDGIPGAELYSDYCHSGNCRRYVFMDMLRGFFRENSKKLKLSEKSGFAGEPHKVKTLGVDAELIEEYKQLHMLQLINFLYLDQEIAATHRFMFDIYLMLNPEMFVRDIVIMADQYVPDNVTAQQIKAGKACIFGHAGQALLRQGRWGEASLMLEKSLELEASSFVLLELACCRFMLGDHDRAYDLVEKAKKLAGPDDVRVNACLSAFLKLKSKYGYVSLSGTLW